MKHNGRIIGAAMVVLGFGIVPVLPAAAQVPPSNDDRPLQAPRMGLFPPAPPPGLYSTIVKDSTALVALGKALFWDTQVALANGQACASCHFHAGADTRTVNQVSPGLDQQPEGDTTFSRRRPTEGLTGATGPNLALEQRDFPFHELLDPTDRESRVLFDTNDVVSSQGSFEGGPVTLNDNNPNPVGQRTRCDSAPSDAFRIPVGSNTFLNARKVEPRNTPTAINAVFNVRNFWDGRASNVFNGVNPFGRRAIADLTARVFRIDGSRVTPQALDQLENMSAASQAVGPVLSSFEMTCQGKLFADVGRRLLQQRALGNQAVAPDDSVFSRMPGGSIVAPNRGLKMNYRDMIRTAFQPAYWQDNQHYTVDPRTGDIRKAGGAASGYQLDELNFSMFFGIAVDAYERTLIPDKNNTPFDAGTMSEDARKGLALFSDTTRANCVACHDGPLFSKATTFQGDIPFPRIERMPMAQENPAPAVYDHGFYNIGVRPAFEDLGVGGTDQYRNPLSFTRQFVLSPGTDGVGPDRFGVKPCELQIPFTGPNCLPTEPAQSIRVAVDGAFKTPSLRNVALTPPYFHNGGQSNLRDVVRFYNRGGDRRSVSNPQGDTTGTGPLGRPVVTFEGTPPAMTPAVGPNMGGSNADPDVTRLGLTDKEGDPNDEIGQIVAFLQALTDKRVACHQAPFDHPALPVPDGQIPQDRNRDRNADDDILAIPAVGAGGYMNCDFESLNAGKLFTSTPAFINMVTKQPK